MLENYVLHPFLVKERLFQCTPPSRIDCSDLPSPPSDWLQTLNTLCYTHLGVAAPAQNHFERHLESNSPELRRALVMIYHRFTGQLDTQLGPLTEDAKTAYMTQLAESIEYCRDGFTNRAIDVMNLLSTSTMRPPESLPELLYHVRNSLVDDAATRMIQRGIRIQYHSIHVWSEFRTVAEKEGFGVQANNPNDAHRLFWGPSTVAVVEAALRRQFKIYFTPLH